MQVTDVRFRIVNPADEEGQSFIMSAFYDMGLEGVIRYYGGPTAVSSHPEVTLGQEVPLRDQFWDELQRTIENDLDWEDNPPLDVLTDPEMMAFEWVIGEYENLSPEERSPEMTYVINRALGENVPVERPEFNESNEITDFNAYAKPHPETEECSFFAEWEGEVETLFAYTGEIGAFTATDSEYDPAKLTDSFWANIARGFHENQMGIETFTIDWPAFLDDDAPPYEYCLMPCIMNAVADYDIFIESPALVEEAMERTEQSMEEAEQDSS